MSAAEEEESSWACPKKRGRRANKDASFPIPLLLTPAGGGGGEKKTAAAHTHPHPPKKFEGREAPINSASPPRAASQNCKCSQGERKGKFIPEHKIEPTAKKRSSRCLPRIASRRPTERPWRLTGEARLVRAEKFVEMS